MGAEVIRSIMFSLYVKDRLVVKDEEKKKNWQDFRRYILSLLHDTIKSFSVPFFCICQGCSEPSLIEFPT